MFVYFMSNRVNELMMYESLQNIDVVFRILVTNQMDFKALHSLSHSLCGEPRTVI